ncbi:MAG: indolepyruvate oxidoreductase subunit beta [Lentisphaeria bacterium]
MKYDILLCGVGGQGILTIGLLVGEVARRAGWRVKQPEVHGMAQRGGAVEASVRLSEAPIHSDLIPRGGADLILAMEPLEALRQLPFLAPDGWVITATEPVRNCAGYPEDAALLAELNALPRKLLLPVADLAAKAGSPRGANMVLLGALSARLPFPETAYAEVVRGLFGRKGDAVVQANLGAFAAGRAAAGQ